LRHQREPLRQPAHPAFLHTTQPQLSFQHVVEDTGNGKMPGPDPAGQTARNRPRPTGLPAQRVMIVPTSLLRSALGYEQVHSELDVEQSAATAPMRLWPAAWP
jgi:hypothetical protein